MSITFHPTELSSKLRKFKAKAKDIMPFHPT